VVPASSSGAQLAVLKDWTRKYALAASLINLGQRAEVTLIPLRIPPSGAVSTAKFSVRHVVAHCQLSMLTGSCGSDRLLFSHLFDAYGQARQ